MIFALEHGLAAGVRMAFDVNDASWGFTPLLSKSFPMKNGCAFFAEFDLDQIQEAADGHGFTAVTMAARFGLGF